MVFSLFTCFGWLLLIRVKIMHGARNDKCTFILLVF